MPLHNSAFTIKSTSGLMRVLISDVNIHAPGETNHIAIKAIWDTGATGSAISKKLANQLGLVQTGIARVNTANGQIDQKTYTVDIGLPNKLLIQGIIATEVDSLASGCDALIGMDIITLGDFSVTNHKSVTCMSFRFPSLHEIDYVKNLGVVVTPNILAGKIGSNFTPPKKKRK